ncbi:ABC transporter permease [Ketogulonicigenium vulgare]|nr:ABC transporter permease [Ketogulonicigenium vulgare]ADO42468.1 binding-protein-dependent transport systems inner membrane component [Ketogulonicigenium vulgare Y25]ALJ80839.1 spermidine/putrescine ABC transporter ATP-binding protein [Ketogulonicigenium vulgare]ANW33618.1 spermidine/putrescine ABC transporter ATP-binding protein [Ketogulonicigenium vulgare]AOZ54380.1 ABC transporter, permease protein [Ketogulonicigenium vulgare]
MRNLHPLHAVAAGLVILFLTLPLVIILGAAVSDTTYLTFPPQGLSLRWFELALQKQNFVRSFFTSLQVSFAATLLALLIGIPTAYALVRWRGALPAWMKSFFFLPVLVPEIVLGFAMLKTVVVDMSIPVMPALIIGHLVIILPYAVRVVGASLEGFDFSIEDAAVTLGASRLKVVLTVILPNIAPGILAAFTLGFITSINDVSVSLFLTGPGISTLPIELFTYVEQHFDPSVAAVSVMMMALTMAVMVLLERSLGLSKAMG